LSAEAERLRRASSSHEVPLRENLPSREVLA
jgi:hypothetical protein